MDYYITIVSLLLVGFGILFGRIRWLELVGRVLRQTRAGMDYAARRRLLDKRKKLLMLQRENSFWHRLEQELNYCGWKRKFPFLTAERWILFNVVLLASVFISLLLWRQDLSKSVLSVVLLVSGEYLLIKVCKASEMRSVNENLLEFLNFLGNYSITAGEVTGIFNQISKYVEEPMKSALEHCCYEAQTTGDAGMALLSMAEKIEHPKFKELIHNMEVTVRYCADFKILVDTSRRSVREYLRMDGERKNMLREAVINMFLLFSLSAFALTIVDGMIDRSIWDILFFSIPGRIALGMTAVIVLMLLRKLLGMNQ